MRESFFTFAKMLEPEIDAFLLRIDHIDSLSSQNFLEKVGKTTPLRIKPTLIILKPQDL